MNRGFFLLVLILAGFQTYASKPDTVFFKVEMENPDQHEFQIGLNISVSGRQEPYIDFSMPVWSPGYYQVLDYARHVQAFHARQAGQNPTDTLRWVKTDADTWRVYFAQGSTDINIQYRVRADRPFVATSFLDEKRAFLKPAGLFMYIEGELDRPVRLDITPQGDWDRVATGLDSIPGQSFAFHAPDYDILYDSPLLVGNLQELPPFYVNGVQHRFIGYAMGEFDRQKLMDDLKRIVEASVGLIGGDIPYPHYTFIGIGPGQGGIEQLNSTAISFQGKGLEGPGRLGTLSFIAHEYFHHYNVKRIRPVELGPFDYSRPNRTNLLWVAEGLTVYYENVILNRAGLMDGGAILRDWENQINSYENNQGKHNQSLAESSAQTWEDGPFGKPGKTISYYVKGPIIGMLLDLRIRTATGNRHSLDDVMRQLYNEYYKKLGRGFTDSEVMRVCEEIAGVSLQDIFAYIYTTKPIDYRKYFSEAGLDIEFRDEADDKGNKRIRTSILVHDQPDTLQRKIIRDMFRPV